MHLFTNAKIRLSSDTSTKKLWSFSRRWLYVSSKLCKCFHSLALCSVSCGRSLRVTHIYVKQMPYFNDPYAEKTCYKALLFSQEVTAQGDHPKHHLNHLFNHIDLPPQVILTLLPVSIHGNVETFVKLRQRAKDKVLQSRP